MQWLGKLRAGAASYWTASIVFVVISVLHWVWLVQSCHRGEVVSGYGAALIMLGVLIAGRYYVREGIARTVERMMPAQQYAALSGERDDSPKRQALRAELRRVLISERYVGVGVVLSGTVLNGYGTPIARLCGWPV